MRTYSQSHQKKKTSLKAVQSNKPTLKRRAVCFKAIAIKTKGFKFDREEANV
jgi:hypothetical protein